MSKRGFWLAAYLILYAVAIVSILTDLHIWVTLVLSLAAMGAVSLVPSQDLPVRLTACACPRCPGNAPVEDPESYRD